MKQIQLMLNKKIHKLYQKLGIDKNFLLVNSFFKLFFIEKLQNQKDEVSTKRRRHYSSQFLSTQPPKTNQYKKQHNYTIKLNYTNKMTKRKKKQREKQENGLIFSPKRSSQHLQPNK